MKKVIARSNQKGGVGKTTTAISLSGCFSKLGYSRSNSLTVNRKYLVFPWERQVFAKLLEMVFEF